MNKGVMAALVVAIVAAVGVGLYTQQGPGGNVAVRDGALDERVRPQIVGEVAAFRLLDEAVDLSALSFADKDGATVSLADMKGRTVLLNLWATWCAPCREEMPDLEELQTELGGERFAVVPVSIDAGEPAKPLEFYRETGLSTLPFFHDGTLKTFTTLKKAGLAFGMPTTVLVDREGFARGVLNGPAKWSSSDAVALIEEAIGPAG